MLDELREHAEELGCAAELAGVEDLLRYGTGARWQLSVQERARDVRALVGMIVDRT